MEIYIIYNFEQKPHIILHNHYIFIHKRHIISVQEKTTQTCMTSVFHPSVQTFAPQFFEVEKKAVVQNQGTKLLESIGVPTGPKGFQLLGRVWKSQATKVTCVKLLESKKQITAALLLGGCHVSRVGDILP